MGVDVGMKYAEVTEPIQLECIQQRSEDRRRRVHFADLDICQRYSLDIVSDILHENSKWLDTARVRWGDDNLRSIEVWDQCPLQ